MKVTRDSTEISASFSVEKKGSGELVEALVIPRIITEKESARQVALHFQAVPARIPLIYIDDQNRAFIMKSDTEFIHLEPGGYLIKMDILMSHAIAKYCQQVLVIGDRQDRCYWFGEN
jgi:hypothetical protein